MPRDPFAQATVRLAGRVDELARVSDAESGTTRTFMSPAMQRANRVVGAWMKAAGLSVRTDSVANLVGRLEPGSVAPKTLLIGSHLDTVQNAGRFDGALGVLLPITAMEILRARGTRLPFAVEIVGFSEEEGVRFSSAYLGSKGYVGGLKKADLALCDAQGVSAQQALSKILGRPFKAPGPAHRSRDLLGYLEVHIEQGPVLEARGLATGVVTAIAGQTRARVKFTGKAGHAGTTPMTMRRDALAGAAEFVVAVEASCKGKAPLVATVGKILARPGAANVIPAEAELSLDIRHPLDSKRLQAFSRLWELGRKIAIRRSLSISVEVVQDHPAVSCSPGLTALLEKAVRMSQPGCIALASGAGHDAVIVSQLTPVAMLFVRCKDGLSHHPDEFVHPRDLKAALKVVVDFLELLASRYQP
jgi:allantoate deiminase